MKEISAKIAAEIHDKAESDSELVDIYTEHVWAGESATTLPGGLSWWRSPVTPFAERINNAYRETQGLVPIPISPNRVVSYRLFEKMLSGDWENRDTLKGLLGGQRIETYLSPGELRRAGYEIKTEKQRGRMHYTLAWVGQS